MSRLQALTLSERKVFESPPELNSLHRKKFFTLPIWAEQYIEKLQTTTNKVAFALLVGYFRASTRFFVIDKSWTQDVLYVCNQLGIDANQVDLTLYNDQTARRHRDVILEKYGFAPFDETARAKMLEETCFLVCKHLKSRKVFLSLLDFLRIKRIAIPGYDTINKTINKVLCEHEKHLLSTLNKELTKEQKRQLETLLEPNEIPGQSLRKIPKNRRYKLTSLKKFTHSIEPRKIKKNVNKLKYLRDLYDSITPVIEALNLSWTLVDYYASWAKKAKISQMIQKGDQKRYLYLIAFVIHQYFVVQDLLTDTYIQCEQNSRNEARLRYQLMIFENRHEEAQRARKILDHSKEQHEVLREIRAIIKNKGLTPEHQVALIERLLDSNSSDLSEADVQLLETENKKNSTDHAFYEVLESCSVTLQNRVSDIVKHIKFDDENSNKALIAAINQYKEKDGLLGKNAFSEFLPEKEAEMLFDDECKFRVSLYKILLFRHIGHALKAGTLNLTHSYRYKSIERYLIPKSQWLSEKTALIKKAGLEDFMDIDFLLEKQASLLDQHYKETNENILSNINEYIKFKKNGEFAIHTPPRDDATLENRLIHFFPKKAYVPLLEILTTVEKHTQFLSPFEYFGSKYIHAKPRPSVFYAGIMGYGCNLGIQRMPQISQGVDESELDTATNWYFSLDNIQTANDKILAFIDQLEVPNYFKKNPDKTHTSSDGQKYNIHGDSLNANHSFKYFGKGKGVSVYSFIDDRHLLFYSTVINSSEREATYVIDGLMNNKVVKSDMHSTDTHGYSETIFATSHLLGYEFAPRIKNLKNQQLYAFRPKKYYEDKGYKIIPNRYVNIQAIKENWDDVLRFIATIKLREATASQLFKRLTSYSKQHPLYTALKAFGQIIKTQFILRYLNDVELRQDVEKQLNKMENAQKFSKAVFFAKNQEFHYQTKEEQDIAESCTRLIKNSIICWNYLYLSSLLASAKDELQEEEILKAIQNSSIVIWRHVNFYGEYDFTEPRLKKTTSFHLPKNSIWNVSKMEEEGSAVYSDAI